MLESDGLRRRLLLATAFAGVGAAPAAEPGDRAAQTLERWRALASQAGAPPLDAARAAERSALLERGERQLASGDPAAALADFDLAAQKAHSADTEMSMVRAWMQQGEYRRAIAFVAHTAQAHRQSAGGALLYAWLLSRGAQDVQALRMLDSASEIEIGSPLIPRVRKLIGPSSAVPEGALLAPPLRLAPYSTGTVPVRTARVVASAVLLEGGRQALTPSAALRGARAVWVRNGLGQTAKARMSDSTPANAAVTVIDLAATLPSGAASAMRDPFPGSPGSVLVHRADVSGAAAWPRLYAGFHGTPSDESDTGRRHLGIDLPTHSSEARHLHGGPVFDAAGHWAGIAVPHPDGRARSVMRSTLATWWPGLLALQAAGSPTPPTSSHAPLDEVYEQALRTGLQLIVQT